MGNPDDAAPRGAALGADAPGTDDDQAHQLGRVAPDPYIHLPGQPTPWKMRQAPAAETIAIAIVSPLDAA